MIKKKRKKQSLFDICNVAFMIVLLLVTLYPLYFTVISSVSDAGAVATGQVRWKPIGFTLEAYQNVLHYKQIWVGYANTIFYTVLGTLFNIALTIPTAYSMSKKYLPHRNIFTAYFLITMYFGGGLLPTYLLVKDMGLLNTRAVLIITSGLSVYNMIVTRTYFSSSISESLYEAAEIDGASELKKFIMIALPLAKPIIAVMTLYYAVGHWNSYFSALIYISDTDLEPLQSVLRKVLILNQTIKLDFETMTAEEIEANIRRAYMAYTMKYAMVFIASAPMLVAYPFVQKYFVKGVMVGSVKG